MTFKTEKTCCTEIDLVLDDNIILDVNFIGGCQGNLEAIRKLCIGRQQSEVIELLKGINCNQRGTSCADQLTIALEKIA